MTNHKFLKGKQNRKSFDILFSLLRRRIIGLQPKLLADTVFLCLQRIYIYGDQIRLFNNMLFLFCHFLWCDCSWFCDCGWGKFLLISLWKWYSLLQSGQAAEINMDWYSNGELRKKVHIAQGWDALGEISKERLTCDWDFHLNFQRIQQLFDLPARRWFGKEIFGSIFPRNNKV